MILLSITISTSTSFIEITDSIIITLVITTSSTLWNTGLCCWAKIRTLSALYPLTRGIIGVASNIIIYETGSTMILLAGAIPTSTPFIDITNSIIVTLMIRTRFTHIETSIGAWKPIFLLSTTHSFFDIF